MFAAPTFYILQLLLLFLIDSSLWQGSDDGNYNCRHILRDHTEVYHMDHELSTPPQDGSNNVDVGSSRKRKSWTNQSDVLDHFTVDPVLTNRARCNYCNT
ncbi:uncharacterized protein LOC130745171 [Lotus japonicus]|uniref:BED-type domain-containing protein n=1 Tax=Lotus japonicus TaxID=34305 RepID=I3RZT3_LOTJA|nr:uncharacterized protein LOC130745171 [Lotus japonicus]AFK33525.1 unknown [Lotus japonicus]